MTTLVLWCLAAQSVPGAGAPTAPGVTVVLADTAEYKSAKAPEATYDGTLERTSGPVYRLVGQGLGGERQVRALYAPGKAHRLDTYVGKQVRLTGKMVARRVEGRDVAELWPGMVEALTATTGRGPGADGTYARCSWQPSAAMHAGTRQYVVRDGTQLARAMRITGDAPEKTATALMARRLGVTGIDWTKHMLICVSAGLTADVDRLTITSVTVRGRELLVSYRLPAGRPGAGFGCPAEAVLVARFDGDVRVQRQPPVGARK